LQWHFLAATAEAVGAVEDTVVVAAMRGVETLAAEGAAIQAVDMQLLVPEASREAPCSTTE
jgi:hypothetical protein